MAAQPLNTPYFANRGSPEMSVGGNTRFDAFGESQSMGFSIQDPVPHNQQQQQQQHQYSSTAALDSQTWMQIDKEVFGFEPQAPQHPTKAIAMSALPAQHPPQIVNQQDGVVPQGFSGNDALFSSSWEKDFSIPMGSGDELGGVLPSNNINGFLHSGLSMGHQSLDSPNTRSLKPRTPLSELSEAGGSHTFSNDFGASPSVPSHTAAPSNNQRPYPESAPTLPPDLVGTSFDPNSNYSHQHMMMSPPDMAPQTQMYPELNNWAPQGGGGMGIQSGMAAMVPAMGNGIYTSQPVQSGIGGYNAPMQVQNAMPQHGYFQTTPSQPNPYPINQNTTINQGAFQMQSHQQGNIQPAERTDSQQNRGSNTRRRREQDAILLEGKARGLTYREIKARMGTNVAESTLRGRYRSLTKDRKDRVRRPVWTTVDLRLLDQIVQQELRRVQHGGGRSLDEEQKLNRISWKRVADYIKDNGGTYHFGNSTCKKKWKALSGSI